MQVSCCWGVKEVQVPYALKVGIGWHDALGVVEGVRLTFPVPAPAPLPLLIGTATWRELR